MLRSPAPSFSVSGPGAIFALLFTVVFGGALAGVYLLVLTFVMNLLGVSIPVS